MLNSYSRNKKSLSIISILLTVVLLFSSFSLFTTMIFAEEEENTGDADTIVREDVSKRGEYEKHYLMGDGSYLAVSYSEQVNYLDESGDYTAVDNTVSKNIFAGSLSTNNDKYKLKFASKASSKKLVTLKTDTYKTSWGITVSTDGENYTELKGVRGKIFGDNSNKLPKNASEAIKLGKASSQVIYENAYEDILDIRYSISHLKLKEDLILKKESDFDSYKVTYSIKNAVVNVNSDGSVDFYNTDGLYLFTESIPIMYDANESYSTDIAVSATCSSSAVEIIYTPSKSWLNDEARVYPITIDPTAETSKSTSNISDVSLYCRYYMNEPDSAIVTLGMDYDVNIMINSFPTLPDGVGCSSAALVLYATNVYNWITYDEHYVEDLNIRMTEIKSPWGERSFSNWDNTPYTEYDYGYSESNPMSYGNYCNYGYDSITYDNGLYCLTLDIPEYIYMDAGSYTQYFESYNGFNLSTDYWMAISIISSENTTFSEYRPSIAMRYSYQARSDINSGSLYRIKNVTTGKYLTVADWSSAVGADISLEAKNDDLAQVMKVTYSTASGTYRIQPFYNSRYVGFSESMVTANNPSVELTNSSGWFSWVFVTASNNNYKIVNAKLLDHALTASSSSNSNEVFISNSNANNNYQVWKFEKIDDSCILKNSSQFAKHDTMLYYIGGGSYTWSSSNTDAVQHISRGAFKAISGGYSTVKAVAETSSADLTMFTCAVNVAYKTGNYLLKWNNTYLKYNNTSNEIEMYDYTNWTHISNIDDWSKIDSSLPYWKIEYRNNGYYSIIYSDNNGNNALTTNSDNDIYISAYSGYNTQLWKIEHIDQFTVNISSKYSSDFLKCSKNNNISVISIEDYPDDGNDLVNFEWKIVSSNKKVAIISLDADDLNNSYASEVMKTMSVVYDKTQIVNYYDDSFSDNTIMNIMQTAEVVVISSHGESENRDIILSSGYSPARLTASKISTLDLNNLKLLLFSTCYGAVNETAHSVVTSVSEDDSSNWDVFEAAIYAGVQNVLAFNDRLSVPAGDELTKILFKKLVCGDTAADDYYLNTDTPTLYEAISEINTISYIDETELKLPEEIWVIGGSKTDEAVFEIDDDISIEVLR